MILIFTIDSLFNNMVRIDTLKHSVFAHDETSFNAIPVPKRVCMIDM